MYYDHEFEGNQDEPCKALVLRRNPNYAHDVEDRICLDCNSPVEKIVTSVYFGVPNAWVSKCKCVPNGRWERWVCAIDKMHERSEMHQTHTLKPCGAPWTSVLHPPDQFRHWCSVLEAGGDCMHFEFED